MSPSDMLCGTTLMVGSLYTQPLLGVFCEVRAGEGPSMEETAQEDSNHNRRLSEAGDQKELT